MVVFMDIDGTIADASRRFLKAGEEPRGRGKNWSKWLRMVQNKKTLSEDTPVPGMVQLCHRLTTTLVYLTGRSEIYKEVTEVWLMRNLFPEAPLLMRPKRNRMKNGKLKEKLIKEFYVEFFGSVIVIDDDQNGDIERMCHKNGYTFLKARSGGLR